MSYLSFAVYAIAFFAGVGLLPGLWYLIGKELPRGIRGVVSRITWTIGALIHGPYAAYWRDSGRVDLVPADPDDDKLLVDGDWIDFDPDGNWSRLGKTQFVVAWEKTLAALDGTAVEADTDDARAEGITLLGQRGGQAIATKFNSSSAEIVVDASRVINRWRGAAGGAIADAAKKDALVEYGGTVDMSTRAIIIGIVASLALGTISGWVMFAA